MLKFRQFLKLILEQITDNNKITQIPCKYIIKNKIRNKSTNRIEIKKFIFNIKDNNQPNHTLNQYLQRATQKDKSKQKFFHFLQITIKKYLTSYEYKRFRNRLKHKVKFYIISESNPSFKIEINIISLGNNSYDMILYTTLKRDMIAKFHDELKIEVESKDITEQIYNIIID